MDEHIKRGDALKIMRDAWNLKPGDDAMQEAINRVSTLPAADVIKRKRGKWIMKEVVTGEFGRLIVCQCSKCKKNQTFQTKYCSKCGAEMEFDKGWYG